MRWLLVTVGLVEVAYAEEPARAEFGASMGAWFTQAPTSLVDVVGWDARIQLGIGAGVVYTVDDIGAWLAVDDPAFVAVARQWHPTASWTVGLQGPLTRTVSVSLSATHRLYVEKVGVHADLHAPLGVMTTLLWRPERKMRPLHD